MFATTNKALKHKAKITQTRHMHARLTSLQGISAFLVPKQAAGFTLGKKEDKVGGCQFEASSHHTAAARYSRLLYLQPHL